MSTSDGDLIRRAEDVRERAHSPYSGIRVGAAVMDEAGRVFTGCNVENASLGLTVCAERNALAAAVAAGAGAIGVIALASNRPGRVNVPCGACRQVIQELAPDARIVFGEEGRVVSEYRISDLLPHAFDRGWAE